MNRDDAPTAVLFMRRSSHAARCIRVFAVIVTAWIAAGCVVDQNKEMARYRKVLNGQKALPNVDIKPGDPLSLEQALLLANRNSEQLAISGENYLQAIIDKERAFSSFLPTVSLAPVLNWSNSHSTRTITSSGNGNTTSFPNSHRQYSTDVPVNGRYNLFNGFQDLANLRRAGYTADQQRALLMDLQQTILLDVATTYYQTLTNERSVEVLRNSVAVQDARVHDMQTREVAGIARPLDVAQTQAQASATRVQLIQAENNVRDSRHMLAYLTTAPVQDSPLTDRLVVPDLMARDVAVHAAEETRQDARAAEAAIEAARQNVQAAIGQWYPSVSLNLSYILSSMSSPTTEWTGAISANIPIFTAGLVHANVRTAWSQLRIAWLNQQQTRRLIAEQVQVAYENVIDSDRRIAELHVEVDAAAEALRQAQSAYVVGLGTNLDVITAQDQLLSSQLSLASEEFNYKIFYLNLQRAMGKVPLPHTQGPPPGTPTSRPTTQETQTPGPATTPALMPGRLR